MLKSKIDVIIVSNRPDLLQLQVERIERTLLYENLIVVDTLKNPMKLGHARQKALEMAESDFVLFLDDDIYISWWDILYMLQRLNKKTIAVTPNIIFGAYNNEHIALLSENARNMGNSGGVCLMDREKILEIGGFDKNTHWGEDFELGIRIQKAGYEWAYEPNVSALHPSTFNEWTQRGKRGGRVVGEFIKKGIISAFSYALKRLASLLLMPVYYALKTKSFRAAGCYVAWRFSYIVGILEGLH